ncbi:MAG: pyridoxamine 5'-phosphate oxidase family protein [Desulfobulbaceae bacterium]|jgi:nitroimidazol reductase NimA-like FMN-containing flavoprotein (pyridoxamine 5'-phosphate oxidase superfamily)|nr:pyridoxamine 5'-phosphate oxidase family protein [Desulfobulbaceae bacterium]
MRRQDRQISEEEALAILASGDYGVLSTVSPDGAPYGLPLNYCLFDHKIYFHAALDGKKLEHIAANPRVSFCVVGKAQILAEQFSTRYASCIAAGVAVEVFGEEKLAALAALVAKYSPGFIAKGADYIAEAHEKTRVITITITSVTGKARQ